MLITFQSVESEFGMEHGTLHLKTAPCIEYLQSQIDNYSIESDRKLQEWVRKSNDNSIVPEEYIERVRLMASELWDKKEACSISCNRCQLNINLEQLIKEKWDYSIVEQGIRVGASGIKIVCPHGHDLMYVCNALY